MNSTLALSPLPAMRSATAQYRGHTSFTFAALGGLPFSRWRCRLKFVVISGLPGSSIMCSRLRVCEYSHTNALPWRSATR